ncbi:MAG TPA: hypothetical protein VF676_03795 [Flavobacterium sp.]|jgi:hypothetical protein
MNGIEIFQQLKLEVLLEYQKHFQYFQGSWKNFSSQDIQNLIVLLEESQKATVSEKWIYTHLKPEVNQKLPRKDMLDIFSRFCGYSGWDELVFRHEKKQEQAVPVPPNRWRAVYFAVASVLVVVAAIAILWPSETARTIEIKDAYTSKAIDSSQVKVYEVATGDELPVTVKDDKVSVVVEDDKPRRISIVSPFYKKREVAVKSSQEIVLVTPDDRAMMLKAFMNPDLRHWQVRKRQLEQILAADLEVIIMLKDNLGAGYYNKTEFSQMLIIPTPSVKAMKIVEIKNNNNNEIEFIRIVQE